MYQNITIGVRDKARMVRNLHSAQHDVITFTKTVHIITMAYAIWR
jgi:hypothetical protein